MALFSAASPHNHNRRHQKEGGMQRTAGAPSTSTLSMPEAAQRHHPVSHGPPRTLHCCSGIGSMHENQSPSVFTHCILPAHLMHTAITTHHPCDTSTAVVQQHRNICTVIFAPECTSLAESHTNRQPHKLHTAQRHTQHMQALACQIRPLL